MRQIGSFMALCSALLSASMATASDQASGSTGPAFSGRHGIGVVRTFMFPKHNPTDPTKYDIDPYTPRWSAAMPKSRLHEIKQAGFDFLRVAIEPGPLFEATGDVFDERISEIRSAIDSSLSEGLGVVLDMHFDESHRLWGRYPVTAGFENPAFQRYIATLRALGHLINAYDPAKVALEVFNEPPPPCDWRDRPPWPAQLKIIHDEARKAAPRSTIIVGGSCWAHIEGLQRLDGSQFDDNTIFTFHYYDPGTFTFQGWWGNPKEKFRKYMTRIPYPPQPDRQQETILRVAQNIESASDIQGIERDSQIRRASDELKTYFANDKGIDDIAASFDKVKEWADRYHVSSERIMLGEFGAMKDIYGHKGADPDDRARWFRDVAATAQRFGYRWAVWALTNTMGLVTHDLDGPLDRSMVRALGLNSQ